MGIDGVIRRVELFGRAEADEDAIHVVFGIDKSYGRPMGIALTSILTHDKNAAFHIFADEISDDDQRRLRETAGRFGIFCAWYVVDPRIFASFPTTLHWTTATYFRFVAGEYFYGKLSRILYLDSDTLAVASLRPLYEKDMAGMAIAAVKDEGLPPGRLRRIGHTGDGYFNAGMLLIDLERWHDEEIFSRAIALLTEHPDRYEAFDQDVLNILYTGEVLWLDARYNQANNAKDLYPPGTVLLHYTTTPKPWLAWYFCEGENLYAKAQEASAWRGVPQIAEPRTARETRLMARASFQRGETGEGIKWYFRYLKRKVFG